MQEVEITTLTPVHVGNGRFLLANTEYVFGEKKLGVVDEAKILALIGEERLSNWVAAIEAGTSLVGFLKGYGIKPSLLKLSKRLIVYKCDFDIAKKQANLKEQIINGTGLPYIPGSSIKGAIRSAVFGEEVRNSNEHLSREDLFDFTKPKGSLLEKKIFGRDPNHDVFRFLQVGDAYFETGSTVAVNMGNVNIRQKGVIFDTSKNQLVEAIDLGKTTKIKLKLNKSGIESNVKNNAISNFPQSFKSLNALFETINEYTKSLILSELDLWHEYEEEEAVQDYIENLNEILGEVQKSAKDECILRLGHGIGYIFISGNLINDSSMVSKPEYEAIVNVARPGNFQKYSEYDFPKTRRVFENSDMLGFVRLKLC